MTRRIVVIGAAGEMAQVAVRTLVAHEPDLELVLTDVDETRLAGAVGVLGAGGRVRSRRLDLFDGEDLRAAIRDADLVLNGAGPFMRTAEPAIRACVAEGVDYLDYDDDPASTLAALAIDDELVASGIACLKNCGHSPGMTNVIAVDVAEQLDEVHELDVLWALGDEGAHVYGRAVVEHWLACIGGEVPTWRDGAATSVRAFEHTDTFPLAGDLGDFRLYEVGHPEPLSLPRRFPTARAIRCMGGLHPQPVNGLSRGLALAVERGAITMDEAIDWAQLVFNDENGPLKVWRPALAGMLAQVRRHEVGAGELLRFLASAARSRHVPWLGAAAVRARGTRDGHPLTVLRRTPAAHPGSTMWTSLGSCTGLNAAAFVHLALAQRGVHHGLRFPEDWVRPPALYAALEQMGVAREDVIEPGFHFDPPVRARERSAAER